MNDKQKLIEAIEQVLTSSTSTLSFEDRQLLQEVKEALKKAKTKEEIINALKPLSYLFHIIKAIIDFFS